MSDKRVYEQLHPETKHGGAPGVAGGGKRARVEMISTFADDTAAKTGVSIAADDYLSADEDALARKYEDDQR